MISFNNYQICSTCDGALPRENVVVLTDDSGARVWLHCMFCRTIVCCQFAGEADDPVLLRRRTISAAKAPKSFARELRHMHHVAAQWAGEGSCSESCAAARLAKPLCGHGACSCS